MDYRVDIVLCIDISSSMNEIVDTIKTTFADSFWKDFSGAMTAVGRKVSVLRIKVITFGTTSEELKATRWFTISSQESLEPEFFKASLRKISCSCSTGKSTALEALDLAFHQDWTQECHRKRHVICLLTNNTAEMPIESKKLEKLGDLWMPRSDCQQGSKIKLMQPAKRLVVVAPQVYPWPEIYEMWDNAVYYPIDSDWDIKSDELEVFIEDYINALTGEV